jgi:hypothetical protein
VLEWAKEFENQNRIVRFSQVKKVRVSTIFLGLDHSLNGGKPVLFETMIFGGKHNEYQERYSTWNEAVEGHKKACELAFSKK